MEHIVTGKKRITLAGIYLGKKNDNGLWGGGITISEMKVTIDSNATSTAKRGDVVGYFRSGKLNRFIFYVTGKAKTYENNCFVVLGHVEGGMDVIQVCHDKHSIGVTISDCGVVIEQD
ncbi:unnamed protein product [Meganyctiphanes norvegica]|uniref:Uncharacterized protein n=1 Tax=Meganyctiphanes norvegica TaxID=48144 RepID=A0AAV2SFM9_MEGNR